MQTDRFGVFDDGAIVLLQAFGLTAAAEGIRRRAAGGQQADGEQRSGAAPTGTGSEDVMNGEEQ